MAVTHGSGAKQAATKAVMDLIDAGTGAGNLVFRKSPSSVASPGTAIATLALSDPCYTYGAGTNPATTGIATFGTITSDTNATGDASNDVAYATLQDSDATIVIHCAVAASASDINMSNGLRVNPGDTVSCSSLTYQALSA